MMVICAAAPSPQVLILMTAVDAPVCTYRLISRIKNRTSIIKVIESGLIQTALYNITCVGRRRVAELVVVRR